MASHSMFWAKTRLGMPFSNASHALYKPVGHHLLDVAAVTNRYLALNPGRLRRESAMTGLLPDAHALLCTALAALHDLGKISPWFQAQAPDFWPADALGEMPQSARQISHWQATAVLLGDAHICRVLEAKLPDFVVGDQTVAAVAGHHGRPPGGDYLGGNAGFHRAAIGEPCIAIARELCDEVLTLLLPVSIAAQPSAPSDAFSFNLNGLITLAD
ncbi:CRISPR-associated endonuclease Cas3'' [Agrobacterium vitis]|uniref:CRISPR-associated endonuclease Cas3'' n=1 Tax=Agrobacterium vitis TaxID=373 RepID=UPI0018D2542A|nr:CRISPR-associated endonuclease Cas3'' [Agrobacterium vitis]